jgi:hypothetical protein
MPVADSRLSGLARVADTLKRAHPELFQLDTHANELRRRVEGQEDPHDHAIDHDRDASSFNRAFFFRNLCKALFAADWFSRIEYSFNGPIYDVGAGAGTFAIAWKLTHPASPSPLILIDRSREQLRLAAEYTRALGLSDLQFRPGVYPLDAAPGSGLRLCSYVLCEQDMTDRRTRDAWLHSFEGSQSLIVDYPSVLDTIAHSLPGRVFTRHSSEVSLPAGLATLVGQRTISVNAMLIDCRSPRRRIIDDYFWSWLRYDTGRLARVFDARAEYHISPRNRTLMGLGAITEYWLRNKRRQQDIAVTWDVRREEASDVFVTFTATFYDIDGRHQEVIEGEFVARFDRHGKIRIFTEHYAKRGDTLAKSMAAR